jgi:hypothetical protein
MGRAPTKIDPKLFEYCTVRQLEVLEAVDKHGGMRPAARALKCDYGTVVQAVANVQKKAALNNYSPKHHMTRPLAPGLALRGTSNLYRRGEEPPLLEWVKTTVDGEQRERIMREAVQALMQDVPRAPPTVAPAHTAEHLCNVITLTDVHVGAYAWGKETGADWDLEIAERLVVAAVRHLIGASAPAATCVIAQLGDFLHQDGLAAVTPTSGHQLDSDSRFSKVVRTAIRILRTVIDGALARHRRVVVLMAEGNHDIASSVWLRHLFGLLYENEPRVHVIDSELPYYVHQHGRTMLAWHHGHLRKLGNLPLLFAAQFPVIWGTTTKRYAHTGHLHHKDEKEHSGITVIQHPTIAARDAYAARGGWISDREMTAITYHDKFGQVARTTVTPEMLE